MRRRYQLRIQPTAVAESCQLAKKNPRGKTIRQQA
jgi:hypothetical protein